jgi:hypothetical protein
MRLVLLLFLPLSVALGDSESSVTFGAFIDAHIAHDFNDPPTRYRQYTTQPYYTDELALNLAHVDAVVKDNNFRGRLALQYGSSVDANYTQEPNELVRYIQEAYGGVALSPVWKIDAGIFFAHFGPESWISRDNYTLSRSLVSDYSPYYQSGIRSTYELSDDLHTEFHIARGWQNISDDRNPCYGIQVRYSPGETSRLFYNTFIGDEDGLRVFNNVVLTHEFSNSFGVSSSFDFGAQNRSEQSRAWWYGWMIVPHYRVNEVYAIAARLEQYRDPDQILIQTPSGKAFDVVGLSLNIDVTIIPNLIWRSEYRVFLGGNEVFQRRESFSASDGFVITSLMYSFGPDPT